MVDPAVLYAPPYTDLDSSGLDGLFDDGTAGQIVRILGLINRNADGNTNAARQSA